MNVLDIQYKVKLDKAKSKPNSINELNKLTTEILNAAQNDGAERYRFWLKKIKGLHPLIDHYLSGQNVGTDISDISGEHILNLGVDTQTVDLKYYYEQYKDSNGQTKENGLLPTPIRTSIRNKLSEQQLKMCEDSYTELNQAYSIIMSTFFNDPSTQAGGDPNNWVVTRNIAHDFYNTQDYLGFSVKLFLYDSQYRSLVAKYDKKLQLLDTITPVSEKILVDLDPIVMTVEGKQLVMDNLGNKIIRMPQTVDKSIITPTSLNNEQEV